MAQPFPNGLPSTPFVDPFLSAPGIPGISAERVAFSGSEHASPELFFRHGVAAAEKHELIVIITAVLQSLPNEFETAGPPKALHVPHSSLGSLCLPERSTDGEEEGGRSSLLCNPLHGVRFA